MVPGIRFRRGSRHSLPLAGGGQPGHEGTPHDGGGGMRCVECGSEAATERRERAAQDDKRLRCRGCGKRSNERPGTPLNHVQYPSDVVAPVVLWRFRHEPSLREPPEMFAVRGIEFCHETVREWAAKLTPALAEDLRHRRAGGRDVPRRARHGGGQDLPPFGRGGHRGDLQSRYNRHVPAHRRRSLFFGRTATVPAILEAA